MNNRFFFLILFLFLSGVATAQHGFWAWAKTGLDMGVSAASGIAVDNQGNAYVTGSFENQLFLGGVTLSGAGGSDVFIAKYSPAGDLLWERTISGPGNEKGAAVAVDTQGNVFVSGTFEGTITLHGSAIASLGETDLFIACYSQSGDFLWVRSAGSMYDDNVRDMVTNPNGGVYVGGQFAETDIYPVPDEVWGYFGDDSLLAEKGGEIFLLNCPADGNIAWAKAIGGFGNNAQLQDISVDGHGNINIAGTFSSYIKIGHLLIASKSSGYINGEIFVGKSNNNGHPLWVNTIYGYNVPGGGKGGTQPGIISGGMIATDNEGSIIVTGKFEGCELMLPPYQISDKGCFMVKYGPGGESVWLKSYDFASPYSVQRLMCNKKGDVFITGTVGQPGIKIGNDILDASGWGNVFIGKYDRYGNEIWGNIIKGDGLDTPRAFATAGDDQLYLAGTYRSSELNFSGHKISSYLNSTAADIFVAAFRAFPTGLQENMTSADMLLYPNPFTNVLTIEGLKPGATIVVVDMLGRQMVRRTTVGTTTQLELEGLPNAPYQVTVSSAGGKVLSSKIVVKN